MDHEEIVEQVIHVVGRERIGRQPRDAQVLVLRATLRVGGQLQQQAGHQVDRGAHLGHFLEQHRHAPIILGGVQAHPGHGILAADIIRVVGLMLVPEEGQGHIVHGSFLRAVRGARRLRKPSPVTPGLADTG